MIANSIIKECHYSWESCFGPFLTDCNTCAANRGDNNTKLPINGLCLCQKGKFDFLKPSCEGNIVVKI